MLKALYPRSHGISVETANRRLESVSDIEVIVYHDHDVGEFAPPRVVRWADLEATDDESPVTAYSAANPVTSHAVGRPDKAIRAPGRREGSVSTTPSRDASSAECLGELRDSSRALRTASSAPSYSGELSQAGGGARPHAMRLFCVGHRLPSDNQQDVRN